VADVLGYVNPSDAVATHVDEEDALRATLAIREGSREVSRERSIINESGVYALIFGSKLPEAKAFKRWVTSEVLPALRQRGGYIDPRTMQTEETIDAIYAAYKEAREKLAIAEPKAEVRDAIYDRKNGYTRTHLHAIAQRELGISGSNVQFNRLLSLMGITVDLGDSGGWTVRSDLRHLVTDYFRETATGTFVNACPHFSEEGARYVVEAVRRRQAETA
jgi:prophage antirepressor-like protein